MDRADLLGCLDRYADRHPEEGATIDRFRRLIDDQARCFHRDCLPAHITSSAWIVARESGSILLTHHRKLERWLQLGGHTDGEANVLRSAIREAEEESGMQGFVALPRRGAPEILDLDIHAIPAHAGDPAHEHFDIRFLLEVSEGQPIRPAQTESKEIRWFARDQVGRLFDERSLLRMAHKASIWLARSPVGPA